MGHREWQNDVKAAGPSSRDTLSMLWKLGEGQGRQELSEHNTCGYQGVEVFIVSSSE